MPNPSRETKFSGANADREMFIFPVQLTTSRIANLTRLLHALAICVTIHTYSADFARENEQPEYSESISSPPCYTISLALPCDELSLAMRLALPCHAISLTLPCD